MKMKKLLGVLAVAVLAAWTCQAVDYSNHSYPTRMFRVALGSGNAPSAADMATIRLHNGDMVLNTDDNVLYIMQATNVYTKIDATGNLTAVHLIGIPTNLVITADNITNALTTAGGSVGGNVPLAAITNALVTGTLAANITGNIAQARITNALATAGAVIGGNLPLAALTNALATVGASYTNAQATFTNIFSPTGVLISHTP
jgi:hypothetical protein